MKLLLFILASIVNLTYSSDSTRFAFTRDNDLYVCEAASKDTVRLTNDGSDVILNGYASWVYYEEIFGRPSRYRAFWWSPDGRKLAFYRFDQTDVPMFPIYSAVGQDGVLHETRYPKVGEPNPKVRIGIIDLDRPSETVWADFDENEDQYFGTPFWSDDGRYLYVQREPRVQQHLDLFRVDSGDGSKSCIYSEDSETWLEWIEGMLFSDKGLYMVRDFEGGWEQIYYLSYDGKELKRLTDGNNWRVRLRKLDRKNGDLYFVAERDSRVMSYMYKLGRKGRITRLTPEGFNVESCWFTRDMKNVYARLSNARTMVFEWSGRAPGSIKGEEDSTRFALPHLISIKAEDGQDMYGRITYPKGFDPSKKYPVHFAGAGPIPGSGRTESSAS